MEQNGGYIMFYRKITNSWIWENPVYLKAWLTILINVNYKDNKVLIQGELYECKRGQSLHSLSEWAKLFGKGWTIQRVRTFFDLLQSDGMIIKKGQRKTTQITVCNYDNYQNPQQTNNKLVTSRQQQTNKYNNYKEGEILKIKTIPEDAK